MDKLTELVSAKSAMPAEWIQPSTEIANLDIDSLDFVELIFEIESEFDIKIPTEWDGEFATMADLSDAIDRLKNSEAPSAELPLPSLFCTASMPRRNRNRFVWLSEIAENTMTVFDAATVKTSVRRREHRM